MTTAKFNSTCRRCGHRINAGDAGEWAKVQVQKTSAGRTNTGHYYHTTYQDQAWRMQHPAEVCKAHQARERLAAVQAERRLMFRALRQYGPPTPDSMRALVAYLREQRV